MAQLRVVIRELRGDKQTPVLLPSDVPMSRLLPALATKMNLPTTQGGRPLPYSLHIQRTGTRLRDSDTLLSAGVQTDDILTLLPIPTAGCFLAGTMVALGDGTQVPIESLQEGDKVLTVHQRTGAVSSSAISQVFRGHTSEYFNIDSKLMVTGSHRIYATGKWKPVRDLAPGDLLQASSGELLEVLQLTRVTSEEALPIYNLHLAEDHTFFANSILVHNATSKALPFDLVEPRISITPKDIPGNVTLEPSIQYVIRQSITAYSAVMLLVAVVLYLANRGDHLIWLKVIALLLSAGMMVYSGHAITSYERHNYTNSIGVLVIQFVAAATLTLELVLLIVLT